MANTKEPKRNEKGVRYANIYAHKQNCEIVEPDDTIQALNLITYSLRQYKTSNAKKYANTEEGAELFLNDCIKFFEYIADANANTDKPLQPDIEGLCIYLGITRKILFDWQKQRCEPWQKTIAYVKECVLTYKKQMANSNKTPPLLQIFDLVNNFGYVNATEFKLSQEQPNQNYVKADDLPNLIATSQPLPIADNLTDRAD